MKPFIAIWHIHSYNNDMGYASLSSERFDSFFEAELHLHKNANLDFKSFIAIDIPEAQTYFDSRDECNWVVVSPENVADIYLEKLASIGFGGEN